MIYSRNGHDITQRYPVIVEAARQLLVRSAILGGELVIDGDGQRPDFRALHSRASSGHALWAFDLLMLNGRDIRNKPYIERRSRLWRVILPGGVR